MTPSTSQDLQDYLFENIPLTRALGVSVIEASLERVVIGAPLDANLNHKRTAFGGSLHMMATLSCWGLLYLNLRKLSSPTEIVIAKSEIDYLLPVKEDFVAVSSFPKIEDWRRFESMLMKKGKGRLPMISTILSTDGRDAVTYRGEFAALKAT